MELDLSILTDDQLVALFRLVLQEAAARSVSVQEAVRSVGLDETEKARIQTAAATRAAERLAREEAERIARDAEAKVRFEKKKAEREASAAKTKELWERKAADAKRLKEILPANLASGNPIHYHVCVWYRGEKRVYVRRETARFGQNCVEYWHTGNARNKPGSLKVGYLDDQAKVRGVEEEQIVTELRDWCASLCEFWTSCEFDTSKALEG